MNVVSIGTERKLFEDSPTRDRVLSMGKSFSEYHIVVFSTKENKFKKQIIGNTHIYPTNSSHKLFYIFDAIKIVFSILKNFEEKQKKETVLTVQDPFECGLVGLVVSKIKNIPLHVQVHTDLFSPFFKNTFLQYIRMIIAPFVLRRAGSIRCDSQRMKDGILKKRLSNAPIDVLPIFIDVKKYEKDPDSNVHDLFPEKRIVILMASRLEPEKEIPMALDVFARICLKYPGRFGLAVVGDGSLSSSLKNRVKRLKIEHSVVFVPWTNNLVSFYKTADLFWINSRFEGYGLTIAEALICGTPVLASDVGAVPEIVLEGKNGLVCPPKNELCFYGKISSIAEDEGRLIYMKDYLKNNPYIHKYADQVDYERLFVENISKSINR